MENQETKLIELINRLKLMEQALLFYSNENNYPDQVTLDKGHQAKFVLDQIKLVSNYENDLLESAKSFIDELNEFEENEKQQINKAKELIDFLKNNEL